MTAIQPTSHLTPPDDLAALGEWIGDLITTFDEYPDDDVRLRMFALLDGIDALHRAALERLVTMLRSPGAETVWSQARADPLVRTVLQLYDLAPPNEPRRFPASRPPGTTIPLTLIRSTTDDPIREEPREPEWRPVTSTSELSDGMMRGFRIATKAVLLCNIDGELFAYDDSCPDTPLTLSNGELIGARIVCPWHGCCFDARTGERLVHRGTNLTAYPVAIDGDIVWVAINTRGVP